MIERSITARHDAPEKPAVKATRWVRLWACGNVSEDVEREYAPESVHDGRRGVGGIFVELDDRARQPANCLLGLLDERRRLAVQACRLEERGGDVVDGRQPLLGAVVVCLAVEFEGLMTAVERYCAVVLALRSNWSLSARAPVAGSTWIT